MYDELDANYINYLAYKFSICGLCREQVNVGHVWLGMKPDYHGALI